jgi:hypothetical protein
VSFRSGRPPFSSSSRAVAPPWLVAGEVLGAGRPGPCPADQASLASNVAFGPLWSAALGHLIPCTKSYCKLYFVSRNFRKMKNLVKCIGNYLLVGKLRMTYQNVQKNEINISVSIACIVNQL